MTRTAISRERAGRACWGSTDTPTQELYERSERLLASYAAASAAGLGAAVYEGKMIDEASRKLAEKLAAAGRAAGLKPPQKAS